MKDLQLSLNKTQKIRSERAFQQLQELSSKFSSNAAVAVADSIPVNYDDGFLKGHGTSEIDGEVVATVCGVVERVNKLVYVRPLQARYKPEIGDIVVGRVIEIAAKRWKLDINFSQNAVLMLSSMNLPDGIQRRRTAVDELNMRAIFVENDVACAEVRGFQHDGSLHLQARSHKYGKLEKGQLLKVPPYLVKRRKQHFNHLDRYGIDLVIGCNGYIWVGEHVQVRDDVVEDRGLHVPLETRESICRMANAVRVLCSLGFAITVEVVVDTVEMSISLSVGVHEMLGAEFSVLVAEAEAERRRVLAKRK